ncbi:MAG: MarR family transcriptional regulator [Promicromonosporaceae bacterium]|nr:MarR family transcriptional regulator [Promicromonosporaceae bacterium]
MSDPNLDLAAHLRQSVGALVRSTRGGDQIAPIPAAVLDLLDARGAMTTAELAAARRVRHQTMAATVADLVAGGHVAAAAHPRDARKKVLSLTLRGRRALGADRVRRVGALAAALRDALDDDERRALEAALVLVDRVAAAVAQAGELGPGGEPLTGAW